MILKCALGALLICYVASFSPRDLLSTKECTWGPSFWCHNITNAKKCNAVNHCIQTVWERQTVQQDDDDICSTCKRLIQEVRDELTSNSTEAQIREVFERSCKLLKIDPVAKVCIKLADEYAPELLEVLSSQMNPDVICSVAGLCNSASVDKMLEDFNNKKKKEEERVKELQVDCEACLDFADLIRDRIEKATPEDIKTFLLEKCRSFGSLSDSCASIVDEYFNDIYYKLKNDFTPSSLCYLTASCINNYSRKVQVKTESDVGVIHVNSDAISIKVKHLSDDQTCDFCKQLVKHLKDILTANTTEIEFKQVMEGICRQTGRFRGECLSIVDEYYDEIYDFLVNDLDGQEVCSFAGICEKPGVHVVGPIASPLSKAPIPLRENSDDEDEEKISRISVSKSDSNVAVFSPFVQNPLKVEISFGDPIASKLQLPVERMVLPQLTDVDVNRKEVCEFCQYFLHYIQKVISQPYGENELKKIVGKACDNLPEGIVLQCKNFVEEFGDTFIAILAQEIDPSQVCPALHVCPAVITKNRFQPVEIGGKPGCPLCLLAVEDVLEKLKNNKTEESVRSALLNLCDRMPKNLKGECNNFVHQYTDKLIDMIIADFTPSEVCTYLKICRPPKDVELVSQTPGEKHEILTNEIPHGTVASVEDHSDIKKKIPPMCIMCEFVMDKIESEMNGSRTLNEVRKIVRNVCHRMSLTVRSECNKFVKNYSSFIVDFLMEVKPKMVCSEMHMCREEGEGGAALLNYVDTVVRRSVEDCALCEALVGALEGLMKDRTLDRNIASYATLICNAIPRSLREECRPMVMAYGPSIINLLVEIGANPAVVCPKVGLCDNTEQAKVVIVNPPSEQNGKKEVRRNVPLLGANECTWGPSHWCHSVENAVACGTLEVCREVFWKADKPRTIDN